MYAHTITREHKQFAGFKWISQQQNVSFARTFTINCEH